MRILKIRLQNLNSLKGIWEIDFTAPPLEHAGLFVIAGDTGAGKSTLLDAITLALYLKTPRSHQDEVMTHGEKECFAEVEFETAQGKFIARWERSRARTGTLKSAIGMLHEWNSTTDAWEPIGSGKDLKGTSKGKGKIEEVTGLSYDQFCKSVILPQGAFAEFLTAPEKDKAAILERLTNTEIFSVLGKAAFDKAKQANAALKQLQDQKDYQQLPTQEAVEAWKLEKKQLGKDLEAGVKYLNALRNNKSTLERTAELTTKLANLKLQITLHEADVTASSADQKRLDRHKKVMPLQGMIHQLEDGKGELIALETKRDDLAMQITTAETLQKETDTTLALARESLHAWKVETEAMRPLWKKVADKDQEIALESAKLQSATTAWKSSQEQLQQWQQQLTELKESKLELEQKLASTAEWLKENDILAQLPADRLRIDEITARLRDHIKQRKQYREDLEAQEESIATLLPKLQQSLEHKNASLAQQELLANQLQGLLKSIESTSDKPAEVRLIFDAQVEKIAGNIKTIEALRLYQANYSKRLEALSELQDQHQSLLTEAEYISKEMLNLHEMLEEVLEEATLREAIWKQQTAISNYERDRASLTDDEPCPLCGSVHHPYKHDMPALYEDTARKDFEKANQRLEALRAQQLKATERYKAIHYKITTRQQEYEVEMAEETQKLLEKIYEDEAEIAQTRTVLLHNCPEASGTDLESLQSDQQNRLEHWKTQRLQYDSLLDQKNAQEQVIFQASTALEQLQHAHEKANSALQLLQDRLHAHENENTADLLQLNALLSPYTYQYEEAQFKHTLSALHQKQQDFENYQKERQQNTEHLNKQLGKLENLQQQLVGLEQQTALLHQAYTVLEKQVNTLSSAREALFGTRNLHDEQEHRQANEKALIEQEAQHAEAYQNQKLQLTTLQTEQKNLLGRINELQTKQSALAQQLAKQANALGFEDAQALQTALLDDPTAQTLEHHLQQLATTTIKLHNQQKDLTLDLASLQKQSLAFTDLDSLNTELTNSELAQEQKNQQLGSILKDLEHYDTQRQKMDALLHQLELHKKDSQRWQRLSGLIGMSDGASFRKFAQSLTLQQLIHYANQHLDKLYGRYYLDKKTSGDLDMEIIDTFQSDNRRSVNTLSGGETFLVSLALALGLSDLAGEKSNIQSLFIDEGFGALDQQTLEIAIGALENLQAQGVKIGIISHIQELKERITAKINVEKLGNGWSRIVVS